jgi:hypothetical protein
MNSNRYPFLTKAQIKEQVESGPVEFVYECIGILQSRQVSDEQEIKTTIYKNIRGWSSSHAHVMGDIFDRVRKGEQTEEDVATARYALTRYSRQLANHFRQEKLAQNPELAADAKMFGIG